MTERLLELSIYGLLGVIVLLVVWVIFRELLRNLRDSEEEFRAQMIKGLFQKWLTSDAEDRGIIQQRLKSLGSIEYIELFFFECFDSSTHAEKQQLRELFELIGIQGRLRMLLKSSPDVWRREEAILKLGRAGVMEDIPLLLDAYWDPDEHVRVKQCCVEAISDVAEPLLQEERGVANLGLLIKLLEIPNAKLREHLASVLSKMDMPVEDMLPYFLHLKSDSGKIGILSIMRG